MKARSFLLLIFTLYPSFLPLDSNASICAKTDFVSMLSICIYIPISTNGFFYTSLISNSKLVILHCFLLFLDFVFLNFFHSTPYSFYLFLPSPLSSFYPFLPFGKSRQERWRRRPKFLGTTATQTEESTCNPVNLNPAS